MMIGVIEMIGVIDRDIVIITMTMMRIITEEEIAAIQIEIRIDMMIVVDVGMVGMKMIERIKTGGMVEVVAVVVENLHLI
jgi:hypothetical protein